MKRTRAGRNDAKYFRKTANRTKKINLRAKTMRGGFRI